MLLYPGELYRLLGASNLLDESMILKIAGYVNLDMLNMFAI
jgi:hypothetical protein